MLDYFYIGSAPYEEECVQVSTTQPYMAEMRAECRRYIERLRQVFGPEPEGAFYAIKRDEHDFGPYLSVIINYDDGAMEYACKVEEGVAKWA